MSEAQVGVQDAGDEAEDPRTPCGRCGHMAGARCTECGREMLCGLVSEPCPIDDCLERVIGDDYGGADSDLTGGPLEAPRHSVRGGE